MDQPSAVELHAKNDQWTVVSIVELRQRIYQLEKAAEQYARDRIAFVQLEERIKWLEDRVA